ncbi:MAG: hypothetical protein JWP10_4 [Nocardioidaceae bacterium]|nr:hypothetical protein [Nocardioidaceae bacterium]
MAPRAILGPGMNIPFGPVGCSAVRSAIRTCALDPTWHGSGVTLLTQRSRLSWTAFLTFAASVAVAALGSYGALSTRSGQDLDVWATDALYARRDTVTQILSFLGYVSIGSAVLALAACFFFGAVRGKLMTAVGAVVIVIGANATTQLLKKEVLTRADFDHGIHNSLPSGHTTLVTSLVLALLLVVPEALRYVAVFGGTFVVTAVGASTVVAGWHRPADVIVALAVCLAWGSGVALVLGARLDVWRTGLAALALLSLAGAALSGVGLVAIGVRPDEGWAGFVDAATVLIALGLSSSLVVALFARITPR